MAVSRRRNDADHFGSNDLGYYSRTNLEDIINNFIVAYTGEGKVLSKVPRHEVAFWAQRAVQEFSYDMFHAENAMEIELGPSRIMPLPADYVGLVKVTWIDAQGLERVAYRNRQASPSQAVIQDQNYDYLYDQNGDLLEAKNSVSEERFQDPSDRSELLNTLQTHPCLLYTSPSPRD